MAKKMDMRFRGWNVRSLNRAGVLDLVTSEIEKHRMYLVGVNTGSRVGKQWYFRIRELYLFYREGDVNQQLGTGFFVHRGIRSVVRGMEFISVPVSYTRIMVLLYCCKIYMLHQKIKVMSLKIAFKKK